MSKEKAQFKATIGGEDWEETHLLQGEWKAGRVMSGIHPTLILSETGAWELEGINELGWLFIKVDQYGKFKILESNTIGARIKNIEIDK